MNTLPCNGPKTTNIHKLSLISSCCNVSLTWKGSNILNTRVNYLRPVLGARCVFDIYSTTTKLADVPFGGSVITLQINNVLCFISLGSNGDFRSFVLHFLITYSVCSLYLYIFIGYFVIVI